jgi:signal transduction histidine kinase
MIIKLLYHFFIILLIAYSSCSLCYAHNITDSLNNILRQSELSDSTKLQLYKLLAGEIRSTSPYKALEYAQNAIELANKVNAYNELVDCLIIKGTIYESQGNYIFAIDYLFRALEISGKLHFSTQQAHIERWISIVFYHQKNYQQALDYANKSLQSSEKIRDRKKVGSALGNIALIYLDKRDYYKSIYYFNKAIPIFRALGEQQALADTQINLLNVYIALQNYTKALELCDNAYIIYKHLGWQKGEELALINYGEIYEGMGNMAKSLEYYHKALDIAKKLENNMSKVYVLNQIAKLYIDNQNLTDAEIYVIQALNLSKQINSRVDIKNAYEILYRIYKTKGISTKALYYYELERQITDSLFNHERDRLLANMHKDYELERKTEEINKLSTHKELLANEIRQQVTWKNLLLVSFIILVGLVFFLWRNNKQKRDINKMLKEQQAKLLSQSVSFKTLNQDLLAEKATTEQLNQELEGRIVERTNELGVTIQKLAQQNEDLADFSHIVSHNLRSPVATLKGLVDMHKSIDYAENPEMLSILISHIDKSMHKLDTVVYDLNTILSVRESITKVLEFVDLQELTRDVIKSRLEHELTNCQAILTTSFATHAYFLGIKSYVENVIYQLVSNAIKYKDPTRQLTIHISTTETANDEICFSVKDNGLGVPNPAKLFQFHQRQHIHIEGTGLGLYLIATQLKAMNGRADVSSEKGEGSEFLIYFKRTT